MGDPAAARALRLERQRAGDPGRREGARSRNARGRRLHQRRDVRRRRPAGVQRARDGNGTHGSRPAHVGPQRAQPGARRAQPVRHRRRLHGQLVVRQSVAHVHGAHGAGRGLRGERAQAPHPVTRRVAQALVAATSFMALFAIVGIALYGLPFFYDFMVREFGWSRAQVTSGNALSKLLVGPLFGFLAGWLVDRFGPRRLMVAGILMAGIALVGLGAIHSLAGFYFFYLFNALGNFCGGPLPNQVLLSRWFTAARGRAMGFAYLGIGVGGALVPFLAVWLTGLVGWQGALQALGLLIVVAALPLALVVKESPDAPVGERVSPQPLVPGPASVAPVLRAPAFYLLLAGSMCSIAAVGGTNQHLKLFLSLDHGYSQTGAAEIASLVLVSSLAGRLGMGWLADRIPKKYVMLLIYLLVAAAIPLLFLTRLQGAIYLFAVVFGIGLGGEYMVIPLMAAELFGVRVLGRAMGVILTGDGVAEAVAPVLVGRNEAKLWDVARAHGIERVSIDLDACLANPGDAIYFDATLTSLRADNVRRAIAAGKHVYCEKPLAATLADALDLARRAEQRGVKHGVVQDKLYLPGVRKLKRLVDHGFFGRILSVRGEFGYWVFEGDDPPAQRPSWNYRTEDGGGIVVDMFAHWRYLLDHTIGAVKAVQCTATTHIPERVDERGRRYAATADDAAYATFVLAGPDGDIVAQFNSSWAVRVYRDDLLQVQVDGTAGSAVAGLRECRTQRRSQTPRAVWTPDVPS